LGGRGMTEEEIAEMEYYEMLEDDYERGITCQ
jgi:hypothetical protein